jgi:uncharacterized protein
MNTTTIQTDSGNTVARRVAVAATFLERFVGLLAHRRLDDDAGLLFRPGGSVHTIGLRFAIDVVFLDAQMRIRRITAGVQPWRIVFSPPQTCCVLELAAGRAAAIKLDVGMLLVEHDGPRS